MSSNHEYVPIENRNLVYIKVDKTGSSTAAGVNRRIAAHHGLSGVFADHVWIAENGEPGAWSDHGQLSGGDDRDVSYDKLEALTMPYFLWSVVREPSKRAMSGCYWAASQNQLNVTAEFLLDCLKSSTNTNHHLRYLKQKNSSTVQDVIGLYDFFAMTDRYDESLVVLAWKLRVPLTDVLYITAKNTSAGMTPTNGNTPVVQPPMEEEPLVVQNYLKTGFKEKNELDYILFEHVDRTLNEIIAANKLEEPIAQFKAALQEVQKECTPEGIDADYLGRLTECYSRDEGCAYKCVDEKSEELIKSQLKCSWCE